MYWLLNERQRRPDSAAFRRRHGSAAASTAASTGERNERRDAQMVGTVGYGSIAVNSYKV
jgi:hypothetical protein